MVFDDVTVRFYKCGNRRYLTELQLNQDANLRAFVEKFKHRFEDDPINCVLWYVEDDE